MEVTAFVEGHAPPNSVWQGQFLPKTINDDVVTLLSAGEVIETLK